MVEAEVVKQAKLTTGRAVYEEKERESEQVFNVEAEKNFFDQIMFKFLMEQVMNDFAEEENDLVAEKEKELLILNQTKKKLQE